MTKLAGWNAGLASAEQFRADVWDAFFHITRRRLPLRYGKDTIVVSPEAAQFLPSEVVMGSRIDVRLYGTDMRLESACR